MIKRVDLFCRTYEMGDLERLFVMAPPSIEAADLLEAVQDGALGWSVTSKGRTVACAFIKTIAPKHASVAALTEPTLTGREWAVITRFVRAKLQHLEAGGFNAISATVQARQPHARYYLERLGFVADDDTFEPMPGYLTLTRRRA